MNRALFSLALAFLLAACGPPRQFVKPGSSEHQAAKDQQECAYEAAKATGNMRTGFDRGWTSAEIELQCMAVRGYYYQ
jgi:hypothetical protein